VTDAAFPQGQPNPEPSGMAWYRLRTGEWVEAPRDDPRWIKGPTHQHRRGAKKTDKPGGHHAQ
jgi:hypothetical protein